jgi:hypothetical protein
MRRADFIAGRLIREQAARDLARHQREFAAGRAFVGPPAPRGVVDANAAAMIREQEERDRRRREAVGAQMGKGAEDRKAAEQKAKDDQAMLRKLDQHIAALDANTRATENLRIRGVGLFFPGGGKLGI